MPAGEQLRCGHRPPGGVSALEAVAEELAAGSVGVDDNHVGGGEPRYILNFAVKEPNPAYAFLLVNVTSNRAVPPMIERIWSLPLPAA